MGRGLGVVDQAVVDGVEGQFQTVGNTKFIEDVVQVILDGLFGDEKFFADFLIAETLSNELDYFFFAIGEERLLAARAGLGRFRKSFHDFGGHAIVEPDFSRVNAMNALYEKIGGGLLQHDATSAQAHCADDVAIIFRSGEYNNARGDGVEIDFFENGKAVFIGHAEIEEKNIGFEFREQLDAFCAVLCFADDGDVFVAVEQFAQAIAKNSVVVCH